jgi:aminoglycoside phosphotransferase
MIHLPSNLSAYIGNAEWTPITIGCSVAQIFRLHLPGHKEGMYLKVVDRDTRQSLHSEYERLAWLQGKLPVPGIIAYESEDNLEYLLTVELSGTHAADRSWSDRLQSMVRELAKVLRGIHSVPIDRCPFDKSLDVRIEEARHNLQMGLVDTEDFDHKRSGRSAESLYRELLATRPPDEELVFTHGDYCLPNILLNQDSGLSGYIDWGNAGVSDRYQDLALAYRSLTHNFGTQWAELFLQEYETKPLDRLKIEFYQLLDEFF